MLCPECKDGKAEVVDTRHFYDDIGQFNYVERKRRCVTCNHDYKTIEMEMAIWNNYCDMKIYK